MPYFGTHGTGKFNRTGFAKIGKNVIFEPGILVFHPENIEIGSNVYIGHHTILHGADENKLIIGDRVWIGPQCYLHSSGGIKIYSDNGLAPQTRIISSFHDLDQDDLGPIVNLPIKQKEVIIKSGCDIGLGSIILPGVTIEEGTQVGAGAVVTKNTERYSIVAGVPARKLKLRESAFEKRHKQKFNLFQTLKLIITHFIRAISDVIFVLFLPLLVIYSWLRLIFKKILRQKPRIIFSPLGTPLPLNAARSIRSQGYEADNFAYECPVYFRNICFGLVLTDKPFLNFINYLTDYLVIFIWAILEYDLFEFSFAGGILMYSHFRKLEYILLKILAKKISVYGYGSDCKALSDVRSQGFKYNNAMDRSEATEGQSEKIIKENVRRAQKYSQVLIAGGDLIHLGKKGIMLPLATDLSYWRKMPFAKNKKVIIAHSTNHRSHKGTRFILEIVEKLSSKLPIEMLLIEKKTIKECQKIYPKADIFVPDVITGWHGFTAIEAMATGRPVVTYLRPDIMEFHKYYAQGRIPAPSANPDNLAQVLTNLVKNPKLREDLGKKGSEYAWQFHSFEFVGSLRAIIYEYIWANKKINQAVFEKEVKKRKLIK
ncbi:MAG: hypothetical protein HW405_217 [Candidatus Berkelbacteria bacterium]|nr:hypothetical protein [Candidatus Berkelbacteria bacterium]